MSGNMATINGSNTIENSAADPSVAHLLHCGKRFHCGTHAVTYMTQIFRSLAEVHAPQKVATMVFLPSTCFVTLLHSELNRQVTCELRSQFHDDYVVDPQGGHFGLDLKQICEALGKQRGKKTLFWFDAPPRPWIDHDRDAFCLLGTDHVVFRENGEIDILKTAVSATIVRIPFCDTPVDESTTAPVAQPSRETFLEYPFCLELDKQLLLTWFNKCKGATWIRWVARTRLPSQKPSEQSISSAHIVPDLKQMGGMDGMESQGGLEIRLQCITNSGIEIDDPLLISPQWIIPSPFQRPAVPADQDSHAVFLSSEPHDLRAARTWDESKRMGVIPSIPPLSDKKGDSMMHEQKDDSTMSEQKVDSTSHEKKGDSPASLWSPILCNFSFDGWFRGKELLQSIPKPFRLKRASKRTVSINKTPSQLFLRIYMANDQPLVIQHLFDSEFDSPHTASQYTSWLYPWTLEEKNGYQSTNGTGRNAGRKRNMSSRSEVDPDSPSKRLKNVVLERERKEESVDMVTSSPVEIGKQADRWKQQRMDQRALELKQKEAELRDKIEKIKESKRLAQMVKVEEQTIKHERVERDRLWKEAAKKYEREQKQKAVAALAVQRHVSVSDFRLKPSALLFGNDVFGSVQQTDVCRSAQQTATIS